MTIIPRITRVTNDLMMFPYVVVVPVPVPAPAPVVLPGSAVAFEKQAVHSFFVSFQV